MAPGLGTTLMAAGAVALCCLGLVWTARQMSRKTAQQDRQRRFEGMQRRQEQRPTELQTQSLHLACPHCDFEGPFDDASLIGEQVDCPLCDQPFVVLEPGHTPEHSI